MKIFFLLLFTLLFAISGCQKEENVPTSPSSQAPQALDKKAKTDLTISASFSINSFDKIQETINLLTPYLNVDNDKKIIKSVEKAIEHISKSLETELWIDDNHLTEKGNKVFDELKEAVKELTDKKFTEPFSGDALAAIDLLLSATNNIAQVAINEVGCDGGPKCEKELQKANEEMIKASEELSQKKYDKTIDRYKKAWEHAQKAMMKVVICHLTGNGTFQPLEISVKALPAHLAHGDFVADADGDGYTAVDACTGTMDDCDDTDAAINPGAAEVCDGIDNNCDGQTDEGVTTTYYQDSDGDGYGNASATKQACSPPTGYVINNTDCNDGNAYVYPGATEICGNSIDDDCDGAIDEGCPCPLTPKVYYEGGPNNDGNAYYNTVQIGTQCWLKENLDVGTRIDGSSNQTNNGTIEKYCYGDLDANCTTYGGLYHWAEAVQYQNGATNTKITDPPFTGNIQGICPTGWHIPTLAEFTALSSTVGGDGNSLKAIGQGTGTNNSGFSALLAGMRLGNGNFYDFSINAYFRSSTEYDNHYAGRLSLNDISSNVTLGNYIKEFGFSVRCLKD